MGFLLLKMLWPLVIGLIKITDRIMLRSVNYWSTHLFRHKHAEARFDEKQCCLNLFCLLYVLKKSRAHEKILQMNSEGQWNKSTEERKQITNLAANIRLIVSTNKRISLWLFFSEPAAVVLVYQKSSVCSLMLLVDENLFISKRGGRCRLNSDHSELQEVKPL